MAYRPSSRVTAPTPRLGIETSAYARGAPSSLCTRPLMVTGFCANARVGASTTRAPTRGSSRRRDLSIAPPGTGGRSPPRPTRPREAGNEHQVVILLRQLARAPNGLGDRTDAPRGECEARHRDSDS